MRFLFWKKCDLCKRVFNIKDMIHGVRIGYHVPSWTFCKPCYKEFMKQGGK